MRPQEIIDRKRTGKALSGEEIAAFVAGISDGTVTDAQAAAFAMAVCVKGMSEEERILFTTAMRDSGDRLEWDLPGPVADKHSTGGVGDNVSLMLAPALAACGAYVPMISGRGLGHTGGTLDKLSAIPGYDIQPSTEHFRKVVREVGCAIIGQTTSLAPADKRLYAIRDETGTVESVDLITASIMSKKLAAGVDALVLDVTCGTGAFMADSDAALTLARAMVSVGNGAGVRTSALVTDMNKSRASAAGNALEVANACAFLTGHEIDSRLWDVVLALGGSALMLSGLAKDYEEGTRRMAEAIESGRAAEQFAKMITALGGPADFMERWAEYMPEAPVIRDVFAPNSGFVSAVDAKGIGLAVISLGGGRRASGDSIDTRPGFDRLAGIGALAGPDAPLARIHALSEEAADAGAAALIAAYGISETPEEPGEPVLERVEP